MNIAIDLLVYGSLFIVIFLSLFIPGVGIAIVLISFGILVWILIRNIVTILFQILLPRGILVPFWRVHVTARMFMGDPVWMNNLPFGAFFLIPGVALVIVIVATASGFKFF